MNNLLKSLALLIFFILSLFPIQNSFALEQTFPDVKPANSYSDNSYFIPIEYLTHIGLLKGYPDGNFDPGGSMNRAELMKMAVLFQGIEPDPNKYKNCFVDVTDEKPEEQWFAPYVCYAKEQGWVEGYKEDGSFRPASRPSYEEALKIVMNPMFADEIESLEITEEMLKFLTGGNPYIDTEPWYIRYYAFAKHKNFFEENYSMGSFDYFDRSDVAELVFKSMITYQGNHPFYHPYFRDEFFKERNLEQFIIHSTCYRSLPMIDFPFLKDHLKTNYDIGEYQDLSRHWLSSFETFPNFDPGYFCPMDSGGFIFSNFIVNSGENWERHLMKFDGNGNLASDEIHQCPAYDRGSISAMDLSQVTDADTFELASCWYGKDSKQVYAEGHPMEEADPASFQPLDYPYSKDAHHVYWYRKIIQEPILEYGSAEKTDPTTFVSLPEGEKVYQQRVQYAKDANYVYYEGQVIEGADTNTFTFLARSEAEAVFYAKDINYVYFQGQKMEGSDSASFEFLEHGYARDNAQVYLEVPSPHNSDLSLEILQDRDGATFQLLSDRYSKDKNGVYFDDEKIEAANSFSFQISEATFLSPQGGIDSNHLFYKDRILDWFDVNTMTLAGGHYVSVGEAIHYVQDPYGLSVDLPALRISDDNVQSSEFEQIESPCQNGKWGKAPTGVYFEGRHFSQVMNFATFKFVNCEYAKDDDQVYVLGDYFYAFEDFGVVQGADPITFEVLIFEEPEPAEEMDPNEPDLTLDPPEEEEVDENYHQVFRDANHLYFKGIQIDSGDFEVQSAQMIDRWTVKDAKGQTCSINSTFPKQSRCEILE